MKNPKVKPIKINVKGALQPLTAQPNCTCGGKEGVAFNFGHEGAWIIPWEDLEELIALKSKQS